MFLPGKIESITLAINAHEDLISYYGTEIPVGNETYAVIITSVMSLNRMKDNHHFENGGVEKVIIYLDKDNGEDVLWRMAGGLLDDGKLDRERFEYIKNNGITY